MGASRDPGSKSISNPHTPTGRLCRQSRQSPASSPRPIWGSSKDAAVNPVAGAFPCPAASTFEFRRHALAFSAASRCASVGASLNGPIPIGWRVGSPPSGLRPINALVDITTTPPYYRGRPLHGFDARQSRLQSGGGAASRPGESLLASRRQIPYSASYDSMCFNLPMIAASRSLAGIHWRRGPDRFLRGDTDVADRKSSLLVRSPCRHTGRKLNINSDARIPLRARGRSRLHGAGLELATHCCRHPAV